ncbi:MAG: cache domain-containing protein [Rhodomicrobium sp.]
MLRSLLAATALLTATALSMTAHAQKAGFGTPAEARAMLEKVVAGMKSDKEKTLAQISKGEIKDRDLYPYCIGPDGKYAAHPQAGRVGLVLKDVKDKSGKAYGEEIAKVAKEGQIAEVSYVFPRPGGDGSPVPKVGLVTKVAGYICVVGYYK